MALPTYRGSTRVQLYTQLAAFAARRARAIFADSEASARDIEKHLRIPRAKIHVVYLAADPRFRADIPQAEFERVRTKYNLPEQFVLYLGGFDVRKNVAVLLQAFARVNLTQYKFVLAGKLPNQDSDFFPDPRRIAQENQIAERVVFPGFIDETDKPALYALARVFVYASQYEGFGLPPLEAMACGTPVLCANTASLPEVVGDAGILLAPDDVNAWSDALRDVLRNDAHRQTMRSAGLGQARKFSWERAARETLAVYDGVV